MTTPERAEAIKALAQLSAMYHLSSPKDSLRADPTALRLRNRAAVLQLSTHANITEDAAAERYYAQQTAAEEQRRREAAAELRRSTTNNGGIEFQHLLAGGGGSDGYGSPSSLERSESRHYMARQHYGSGSRGGGGGFGSSNSGALEYQCAPPPPVRRDSAIGAVESLVTLANSYAATGRFTDAVRVMKRAIAFAENQFRPNEALTDSRGGGAGAQRAAAAASASQLAFKKSTTQTSVMSAGSSAPTVSSIAGSTAAAASSPTRRVGFSDDRAANNNNNGGADTFNIDVLKSIHDANASFASADADAFSSSSFAGVGGHDTTGGIGTDTNLYVNQPQLVPLLVSLSTFLDAEGSRHEAQCIRDRVRAIAESVQGIGTFDYTNGKTDYNDDMTAAKTVLTAVGDQFAAREHLLEIASPAHERRVAEDLLAQRTRRGGGAGAIGGPNQSIAAATRARLSMSMGSASPERGGSASASMSGDASPGSIAYVRNRNFYKY